MKTRLDMQQQKLSDIIAGLQSQIDALYQLVGEDPPDAMIRTLAETFSRMNDDQQAKFFNEVAAIMKRWPNFGMGQQAFYIGRHLKRCECSTEDARDFIREVHEAMTK